MASSSSATHQPAFAPSSGNLIPSPASSGSPSLHPASSLHHAASDHYHHQQQLSSSLNSITPRHMLAAQQHFGAAFAAAAQQQHRQQGQATAPSPPQQQHPHANMHLHQQQQQQYQQQMHAHAQQQHLAQQFPHWVGPNPAAPDEAYLRHLLAQSTGAATFGTAASQQQQQPMNEDASPAYAGSSGDSPYSLHDFVLGAAAAQQAATFPTPPDSGSDGSQGHDDVVRNSSNTYGMYPDSGDWSNATGLTLDPNALNLMANGMFNAGGQSHHTNSTPALSPASGSRALSNSNSSYGGSPPYSGGAQQQQFNTGAGGQQAMLGGSSFSSDSSAMFTFGTGNGFPAMPNMHAGYMQQPQQMQHQQQPQQMPMDDRKRSVAPAEDVKPQRKASTSGASRKRPRAEVEAPTFQQQQPQQPMLHQAVQQGPAGLQMEVGSNATAQAAIQRLKQRQAALAAAAAAQHAAAIDEAAHKQATASTSNGSKAGAGAASASRAAPAPATEKGQRKIAHNAIERRYRNNINDRIAALRAAVPALHNPRPLPGGRRSKRGRGVQAELVDGVPAVTKLNKATILGTATAYIRVLKARELRLASESAGLRQLLSSLEGGDELLELWQAEMEKVNAAAAAEEEAHAIKDEDLSEDEGEEDEEDDEDEDEADLSGTSARSAKRTAGVRGAPRVLTAALMAVAMVGPDQSDSSASSGVVQHLARRSEVFDEAPAAFNAAVESTSSSFGLDVVRFITFAVIVLAVSWPLLVRLFGRRARAARRGNAGVNKATAVPVTQDEAERQRKLLDVMARSHPDAREMNAALRAHVLAPTHVLCSSYGLLLEASAGARMLIGLRPADETPMSAADVAVWTRLLDVETALGPLAQSSLTARLYTIAKLANALEAGTLPAGSCSIAYTHASLALALLRALPGNALAERRAASHWQRARRARLIAADAESTSADAASAASERWLDPLLRQLDAEEALQLVPAPTEVSALFAPTHSLDVRAAALSPLRSAAARMHDAELNDVWTTLLAALVRRSCPPALLTATLDAAGSDERATALSFARHTAGLTLELDLTLDLRTRESLSTRIAALVSVAPPSAYARNASLAQATLGAWALMLNNGALAQRSAAALLATGQTTHCQTARALVHLVLPASQAALMAPCVEAAQGVDNLASTTLNWLLFLRAFAALRTTPTDAHRATLQDAATALRVQLACMPSCALSGGSASSSPHARGSRSPRRRNSADVDSASSASSTPRCESPPLLGTGIGAGAEAMRESNGEVDKACDRLTDILSALSRTIATRKAWDAAEDEADDSGVEWA